MLKFASLIYILVGPTLAGIAVAVVLAMPFVGGTQYGTTDLGMIGYAALIGAVLAIPASIVIGKMIQGRRVA